ncbi:MAG: hypothetical protein WA156_03285 [Methylocystis silviterrae]
MTEQQVLLLWITTTIAVVNTLGASLAIFCDKKKYTPREALINDCEALINDARKSLENLQRELSEGRGMDIDREVLQHISQDLEKLSKQFGTAETKLR